MRDILDEFSHPYIIIFNQSQLRQGVIDMCVESGRNKQHLGLELLQGGCEFLRYCLAKASAIGVSRQWHVNHALATAIGPDSRIEWMLKSRAQHYFWITLENIFCAVAVMHIEINNRH